MIKVQTSFSRYVKHGKKREDLDTVRITTDSNDTVREFYHGEIKKQYSSYNVKDFFVYATTECEKKCSDTEVYFMDLRIP